MVKNLDSVPWARRLKVRHLEVFLTLHETGSLTSAAAALHMTQPAMSHWLADIEEVVGCPLFVRGRRLALTEVGEVLRSHSERMLGDVRRTDAELQAVRLGLKGRLHVGMTLPPLLLPGAIVRLQNDSPDIFVSVVESSLPDLLDRLSRCEVDVVVGALSAIAHRPGVATESLISDRMEVVARRGHPLLTRQDVQWQELGGYPWILPPVASVTRGIFDEAFAMQQLPAPVPCVEATSSVRMHLMMGDRNYLSVMTASEVRLYRVIGPIDRVQLVPGISFPDIGAIWMPDRASEALKRFLDALRIESHAFSTAPEGGFRNGVQHLGQ